MKPASVLAHEFVEFIPEEIREGTVYVCIPFATVVHRCCCGCGYEVITPLSPTDWKLIFDGVTISLHPSIGNWGFPCQSHYWIRQNKVLWASRWSQDEIEDGRTADALAKSIYFNENMSGSEPSISTPKVAIVPEVPAGLSDPESKAPEASWWRNLFSWLFGR